MVKNTVKKVVGLQPEGLCCTNAPQRDTGTEVVIDLQENRAQEAMVLALCQVGAQHKHVQ